MTILTTCLIAYRIHSVSRNSVARRRRWQFSYILDILIQSSAAYSAVSILEAVTTIIAEQLSVSLFEEEVPNRYASPFYTTIPVRTCASSILLSSTC